MNFLKFINNINSWQDFRDALNPQPKIVKGDAFEYLTKYTLQIIPRYKAKLKKVWLSNELPPSKRKHFRQPTRDIGIDLYAETYDGEYWAIQCKYHSDESRSVTHSELSTFMSDAFVKGKNLDHGLVCTNANRYSKYYEGIEKVSFLTGEDYRSLDKDFFDNVRRILKGKEAEKIKPYKPRPHQRRAIKNAEKYFIKEKNSRGKLIFPCGTGKSLVGYWIAKQLNAKRILVAVPSLALIKQTLETWLREVVANDQINQVRWICVCSDQSVGKNDDVAVLTQDLGVPCTTDINTIQKWLAKPSRTQIVFSTYQSAKVLSAAFKSAGLEFDLAIMDEAHKTVGRKDKLFSHLLYNENLKIKKRIFMTATERRYLGNSEEIASMDDPKLYGETFELLTFKEALEVNPPILSDYKIITFAIDKSEVTDLIANNVFIRPDKGKWDEDIEARSLASLIALRKAMKKHPINHAVTFHSSISKAEAFQKSQKNFELAFPDYKEVEAFHVKGTIPTSERSKIINEFTDSNNAVITNARCLTEGLDVPKIDCVLFADPRRSAIDIVQAVGRALRIVDGKKQGYIIIPILIEEESHEPSDDIFKEILMTLRALAANDDRIIEYFRAIQNKTRRESSVIEFDMDERLATKVDINKISEAIELRIWSKLAKISWMPFEEARDFVQNLNLKSNIEWREYTKSGIKPEDIPTTPERTYSNNWQGFGDWLGTGTIASKDKEYRSFEDARDFVHKLDLKGQKQWREYNKSGNKPDDIPSTPEGAYKNKGWKDFGDWLGSGTIANRDREFKPFEDARDFVHKLGLKSQKDWGEYCKSGNKPDYIPAIPRRTYLNDGWKGFGDWLGTGTIAARDKRYRPFMEAREFVRILGLNNREEWREYCNSGNKPEDIPSTPERTYKTKGWHGLGDWLGTGTIASKDKEYRSFKDARDFVRMLGLKSQRQWGEYCKSGNKPDDIPATPERTYKNKGWQGLGYWLGTGTIAPRDKEYRSFEDARDFVHKLDLQSLKEWEEYCKSGYKPDDIPATPERTYKNKGWQGAGDWLGTGTIATFKRRYKPFEEAKAFAQKLGLKSQKDWGKYYKSGNKPDDIPAAPERTYSNKGWQGMGDWLGTGIIAPRDRKYMPFEEARDFVHKLGLKSQKDWGEYCKSGNKPDNIPAGAQHVYSVKGWNGWRDWLGY